MKKLLSVLFVVFLAFLTISCKKDQTEEVVKTPTNNVVTEPVKTTYTVIFEANGERHATLKVKEGETITATIPTPQAPEGYAFVGWLEGDTLVDLSTYVVTKNVTFVAKYESQTIDNSLDVNATKEEGKEYYLVIGWWETTGVDSNGDKKYTSYLTEELVRLFYGNLNLYLKAKGASDSDLANVQVRNYSSDTVADMGALVLADGDVDIMIGVGNNVNSTAGLTLYESSNDNKFATEMGSTPTSRYVALLSSTNELGVNVFDWLRTDTGKKAFNQALKESDIVVVPERTNVIDLTVTVHGDTDVATHLEDNETAVTMPTITVADGYEFKGFAKSSDGEVVLNVTADATLTYANLKSLINVGDTTLDLYPVIQEKAEKGERVNFVVVGWYNKVATSGLDEAIISEISDALKAWLISEGVSSEDVATVLFKGYEGNVGPSTQAIVDDNDVDIMIGWGSNISSTGVIPASSVLESLDGYTMGEKSGRYVQRLSDDESVLKAMEWFKVANTEHFKAPQVEVIDLNVTVHGDTDVATHLEDKDTLVAMPEITVADGYEFKGFALSSDGEVVLTSKELKYQDFSKLITEGQTSIDLYPICELVDNGEEPTPTPTPDEKKLSILIQLNNSLKEFEVNLLIERFNALVNDDEEVTVEMLSGNADAITTEVNTNHYDVVIGGNNPLKNYELATDTTLANACAMHFADGSRKIVILKDPTNLELALKFYNFVTAEAPELEFHVTFWRNAGSWVTDEEFSTIKAGVTSKVLEFAGVETEELLSSTYNIKITYYDTEKTKVADLVAETTPLDTTLIIGCGKNVDSSGNMVIVSKKDLGSDFVAASSRYVALVKDTLLSKYIYDYYFVSVELE